tara:strand:+ start:99 stop:329 length:231 start_codon:yes stop_codon:yes gene_type:complete
MKEQTLIMMNKKVEALTNVIQHLLTELTHLRELGVGTLETIKLMPGYEGAIEELKQNMTKEKEKLDKEEKEEVVNE